MNLSPSHHACTGKVLLYGWMITSPTRRSLH
nr:MAG TPA: hypothetical protein [Caudoviricetes sp.]